MHCRGSFVESPRRDETQVRSPGWLHQLDRSAPDHRVSGSIEFQKINPVIRTGDNTNCIGHTYVFNHSVPEHCVSENQSGDLFRWITGLMVIPHCCWHVRWNEVTCTQFIYKLFNILTIEPVFLVSAVRTDVAAHFTATIGKFIPVTGKFLKH